MERKLFKDMIMQGIDKNIFKKHKPNVKEPFIPHQPNNPNLGAKIDFKVKYSD